MLQFACCSDLRQVEDKSQYAAFGGSQWSWLPRLLTCPSAARNVKHRYGCHDNRANECARQHGRSKAQLRGAEKSSNANRHCAHRPSCARAPRGPQQTAMPPLLREQSLIARGLSLRQRGPANASNYRHSVPTGVIRGRAVLSECEFLPKTHSVMNRPSSWQTTTSGWPPDAPSRSASSMAAQIARVLLRYDGDNRRCARMIRQPSCWPRTTYRRCCIADLGELSGAFGRRQPSSMTPIKNTMDRARVPFDARRGEDDFSEGSAKNRPACTPRPEG
jgi:hypothetical protein